MDRRNPMIDPTLIQALVLLASGIVICLTIRRAEGRAWRLYL